MAPIDNINAVRQEVEYWREEYKFEKEQTKEKTKEKAEEYIDPWIEMMRASEELKEKYSFLSDFMEVQGINVVKEKDFDESILDKSGNMSFNKWDSSGLKYFIVKNNGEMINIPYEMIGGYEGLDDNWFEWKTVFDFIDEDTNCILEHHYDSAWNDQSPLYIIPYVTKKSNSEDLILKEETGKRLRRKNDTITSIKSQLIEMEIDEKLPKIKFEGNIIDIEGKDFLPYMYNLNFYTKKDDYNVLATYMDGGASEDKKISEIIIKENWLSLNVIDSSFEDYINVFLNYYMRIHAKL